MEIIENARSSGRHKAAWDALDHLPLTEQPSNLRASWPVWAALLAYGAVVVLVAAWVWP
jgi:hypothetical protein